MIPAMSSLRSLLVHLDGSVHAAARLRVAAALAQAHEAVLHAVFAEPAALHDSTYGYSAGAQAAAALQEAGLARRAKARALLHEVLGERAAQASWLELNADQPARMVARHASAADLLVLGQRHAGDGVPQDFVESVILEGGRPALVWPGTARPRLSLDTVVVAWKPSATCTRAVAGALPLLKQARRVLVVSWAEERLPPGAQADVEQHLRAHGVQPEMQRHARVPRDVGAALRELCHEVDAGLLVMGCYGHTRLRERVLGGATRSLLQTLPVPLLMAH